MKKIIFSIFLASLLFGFTAKGQEMLLKDPISNSFFKTSKYSGVKGSPFLYEKWYLGEVNTPKGVYKNLMLKLDMYENILYFQKDDQLLSFADHVNEFKLQTENGIKIFKRGFSGSNLKPESFVEILLEKKNYLLIKSVIVNISEVNEINSGIIKTFKHINRYYLKTPESSEIKHIKLNG